MGPRPGLVTKGSDPVQEAPTMYFVVEDNPTRCFIVCAYSGDHARSVIKDEFPDFDDARDRFPRVVRLQRGIAEPIGVLDAYELSPANQPRFQQNK